MEIPFLTSSKHAQNRKQTEPRCGCSDSAEILLHDTYEYDTITQNLSKKLNSGPLESVCCKPEFYTTDRHLKGVLVLHHMQNISLATIQLRYNAPPIRSPTRLPSCLLTRGGLHQYANLCTRDYSKKSTRVAPILVRGYAGIITSKAVHSTSAPPRLTLCQLASAS